MKAAKHVSLLCGIMIAACATPPAPDPLAERQPTAAELRKQQEQDQQQVIKLRKMAKEIPPIPNYRVTVPGSRWFYDVSTPTEIDILEECGRYRNSPSSGLTQEKISQCIEKVPPILAEIAKIEANWKKDKAEAAAIAATARAEKAAKIIEECGESRKFNTFRLGDTIECLELVMTGREDVRIYVTGHSRWETWYFNNNRTVLNFLNGRLETYFY